MELSRLTIEQMEKIYKERMVRDFPPAELKPLEMMLELMQADVYECYGLMEHGQVLAYAFFLSLENHYLFDYLAVAEDARNAGIGSIFLGLLRQEFSKADSVIGEVENPEYAESQEQAQLQQRRYGFYLRNGFRDTGVKALMFGVEYLVLEMGIGAPMTRDYAEELYNDIYRSFLTEEKFRENVRTH